MILYFNCGFFHRKYGDQSRTPVFMVAHFIFCVQIKGFGHHEDVGFCGSTLDFRCHGLADSGVVQKLLVRLSSAHLNSY